MIERTLSKINKLWALALALIAVTLVSFAVASAQAPTVRFNNANGVSGGIGSESDFLRINNATGGNTAEACTNGQEINLWFYVHNTNPSFSNGTNNMGIGVATGTFVDLDISNQSSFEATKTLTGKVGASNAHTTTDTATITCGSENIKVEYVSQSMAHNAPAWNSPFALTGNIMNNASLGYDGGVVPGCWEYRAYITVTVRVVTEPPAPEPYAVCTTLLTPIVINKTNVELEVTRPVEGQHYGDTTVTGYGFEIVDKATGNAVFSKMTNGIDSLKITASGLPAGSYTATATIKTAIGNATPAAACVQMFDIEADEVNLVHTCQTPDLVPVAGQPGKYDVIVNYTASPAANVQLVNAGINVTGPAGFTPIAANSTTLEGLMIPQDVQGTYKIVVDLTFNTIVDGQTNTVTLAGSEAPMCMNSISVNPNQPPTVCEETGSDVLNTGAVGECRYKVCNSAGATNQGQRGDCRFNNVPAVITTTPRTGATENIALLALVTTAGIYGYRGMVAREQN